MSAAAVAANYRARAAALSSEAELLREMYEDLEEGPRVARKVRRLRKEARELLELAAMMEAPPPPRQLSLLDSERSS